MDYKIPTTEKSPQSEDFSEFRQLIESMAIERGFTASMNFALEFFMPGGQTREISLSWRGFQIATVVSWRFETRCYESAKIRPSSMPSLDQESCRVFAQMLKLAADIAKELDKLAYSLGDTLRPAAEWPKRR